MRSSRVVIESGRVLSGPQRLPANQLDFNLIPWSRCSVIECDETWEKTVELSEKRRSKSRSRSISNSDSSGNNKRINSKLAQNVPACPLVSTPLASNRVPGCVLNLRAITARAMEADGDADDEGNDITSGTKLCTQPHSRGGHKNESPAITNGSRQL